MLCCAVLCAYLWQVTCPGVHLPEKDDVYLSVCLMNQYRQSECLPAVFPLLFREKMRFEKVGEQKLINALILAIHMSNLHYSLHPQFKPSLQCKHQRGTATHWAIFRNVYIWKRKEIHHSIITATALRKPSIQSFTHSVQWITVGWSLLTHPSAYSKILCRG